MLASFGAHAHRRTGRAIAQWERDHERNGAGGGRTEAERRIIQTSPVDDAFRQRPLEGGLQPLRAGLLIVFLRPLVVNVVVKRCHG